MIERYSKRLVGWKGTIFSQARKTQLIKSILHDLLIYFMLIFKMLIAVRDNLDQTQKNFLWSGMEANKWHVLVIWDKFYKHKKKGDLGIHNIYNINMDLMDKLGWKVTK